MNSAKWYPAGARKGGDVVLVKRSTCSTQVGASRSRPTPRYRATVTTPIGSEESLCCDRN